MGNVSRMTLLAGATDCFVVICKCLQDAEEYRQSAENRRRHCGYLEWYQ
jgi:hypothetical protein